MLLIDTSIMLAAFLTVFSSSGCGERIVLRLGQVSIAAAQQQQGAKIVTLMDPPLCAHLCILYEGVKRHKLGADPQDNGLESAVGKELHVRLSSQLDAVVAGEAGTRGGRGGEGEDSTLPVSAAVLWRVQVRCKCSQQGKGATKTPLPSPTTPPFVLVGPKHAARQRSNLFRWGGRRLRTPLPTGFPTGLPELPELPELPLPQLPPPDQLQQLAKALNSGGLTVRIDLGELKVHSVHTPLDQHSRNNPPL